MSYFARNTTTSTGATDSAALAGQYSDNSSGTIQAKNPMTAGINVYGNGETDGADEQSSLLGSTSSAQPSYSAPVSNSWLSSMTTNSAPKSIPSYPSLDPVAQTSNAREMTTFSSSTPVAAPLPTSYASYPPTTNFVPPAAASASVVPTPMAAPVQPVRSAAPPPPPQVQSYPSQQITVESSFIEELIAENSRLTLEVEDLRKIIQMQEQQFQDRLSATTQAMHGGRPMTLVAAPSQSQLGGVPLSSATYNPGSGVTTLNPTNGPNQGTKNVCCGHCHKWLLVPINANLIFCPNCERVNNCSLRT